MSRQRVETFGLRPGTILAERYEVLAKLGSGWEGEVYLVSERAAGVERTAKLFFPQRNPRDRTTKFYARKLHKLRHCPIVVQYHTQESIELRGVQVKFLVSEFVEGEILDRFVRRQRGRRLQPFQAVHLLHALARGVECIHRAGDYHGDLHVENVMVKRVGLEFDLKLIDMFHWGAPTAEHRRDDIVDLVRLFYDVLGGQRHYAGQPPEVKSICRGLKRSLILGRFRTMTKLREYLETMEWA